MYICSEYYITTIITGDNFILGMKAAVGTYKITNTKKLLSRTSRRTVVTNNPALLNNTFHLIVEEYYHKRKYVTTLSYHLLVVLTLFLQGVLKT